MRKKLVRPLLDADKHCMNHLSDAFLDSVTRKVFVYEEEIKTQEKNSYERGRINTKQIEDVFFLKIGGALIRGNALPLYFKIPLISVKLSISCSHC